MCQSMVDIQPAAAEIRREKRKKDRQKEITGQKYNGHNQTLCCRRVRLYGNDHVLTETSNQSPAPANWTEWLRLICRISVNYGQLCPATPFHRTKMIANETAAASRSYNRARSSGKEGKLISSKLRYFSQIQRKRTDLVHEI